MTGTHDCTFVFLGGMSFPSELYPVVAGGTGQWWIVVRQVWTQLDEKSQQPATGLSVQTATLNHTDALFWCTEILKG